jgi:hypothetical protein
MARLPEPINSTVNAIYAAYEAGAESGHRPHLGASLIGHACERYLWLTFRWAEAQKFPGRVLRLFETGQREEARFVADLRRIQVEVHDTTPDGGQWQVSTLGGHFGGSLDGACVGLPEAPRVWHVVEAKTHNDKSFRDLVSKGVQKSKPQHWAQMIVYMGLTGMERALYIAKNKNDDELYTERVHFDPIEFAQIKARAERVISAKEPPLRVSEDPSWYVCKMCHFAEQCHGTKAPEVNCRTCVHATPEIDGNARWSCAHHNRDLDLPAQRAGCTSHRYIPILLQRLGTQADCVDGDVVYQTAEGAAFKNGESADAFASEEIRAMEHKSLLPEVGVFKKKLAAEGIVGAAVVR